LNMLLDLEGIHTFYARHEILKGISLRVTRGDIVALLGTNGAGKTTLLKTISGIIRPKIGKIVFQGAEIQALRPDQIVRCGISQCPEGRKIFPDMSVQENLRLGAYLRRDVSEISGSFEFVFGLFPILKERSKQAAGTLSGGEQQMLAMARALMARPELFLLDEPSLGLAPLVILKIYETVRDVNKVGTTVLVVEQNASIALKFSRKGYVLENGQIVLEDASENLIKSDKVKEAYLGG
jgi:branched-chain amino acid transport system ATP-binding protein